MTNSEVLNSWKEIATYVGRGVRTVQRWERELNLPVRRPRGKQRSAVIAIKQDIDLWLRTPHNGQAAPANVRHRHANLMHNAELLKTRASMLCAQSDALQKQLVRMLSIGSVLRATCRTAMSRQRSWAGLIHVETARAIELGATLQFTADHGGGRIPRLAETSR